jgi:hypothetical protein
MPFQVISPMLMNIDGSDFNEAVKNFVKLNRHLNINELILTDQINNMRANIRYYNKGGRNKAGINLYPTTSRVISTIPGTSMSMMGGPIVGSPIISGISSNDPNAPFPLMPGFGQPSAMVGPNGLVRRIEPVVPVTLDGRPLSSIQPMMGVSSANIVGVSSRGPIIRPGIVAPMIPPTPITFAPASTVSSTTVMWVDNTDNKVAFSDEIEKAYSNVTNKNIKTKVVVKGLITSLPTIDVNLEFEKDLCKVTYAQPGGGIFEINIKRKGPASPNYKLMVMSTPRIVGPLPRF